MSTIVYSHGFGVEKDDRGLFTDIASALPEVEHVMFDYNLIDKQLNTLTVSPLQQQSKLLKEQLGKIEPNETIDIIAHSQGCVVAAIAKPKNIRKMFFIAPPDKIDTDRIVEYFGSREGRTINVESESKVSRRDGSTTIIPPAYWKSLRGLNVMRLYNHLPDFAEIEFLIAKEDEVLGMTNFDEADERIGLLELSGSHDFTGESRDDLIEAIKRGLL